MKSPLTLGAVCLVTISSLLLVGGETHAGLLAYEPFTNAPGTAIIGAGGGFGFNGNWQSNTSTGTATNTGFALSYTDGVSNSLVTVGGAAFFQGGTTGTSANNMQPIRLFNFSRGTNGTDGVTTWISFLAVRLGPVVAGNNPYPRGANVPHDLNAGALQKLATGNSSGAATNTVGLIPLGAAGNLKRSETVFSQTNFIVVRVDHKAAALDDAYLFLNPTLGVEPLLSQAATNTLGTYDFSFDRLRVFAGGNVSAAQPYAELLVDEYRIGESYVDVTPFASNAPPVAPAGLTITNAGLVPGGFVLSGVGGSNSGTYRVLATTNIETQLTSWLAIATNTFDGNGNFHATNPTTPGAPRQFFRLLAGPVPVPPVAPAITTQPTNQSVFAGQNVTLTAAASGTAPLSYQWWFNTNTPLPGATTATLTLNNVQSSNAGSYLLIVTNLAGAATSAVAMLTVNPVTIPPANYYISPTGSDANSGTNINQPWFSLSKATAVANPGNLIYLRGGTYNYSTRIQITRSGTAAAPIRVSAYPGELPVFDFSSQSSGSSSRGLELSSSASYWQFYRLEIAFTGDNGMWIGGKSNLVEFCSFHDCEDSGLQLANAGTSYNFILNCDSYRNYDPAKFGENADGFAAKFTLGPGNVFSGCRSWENSDDGWDFWETAYQIVMTNCWTFHNGYDVFGIGPSFNGNGNGFKLGGNYIYGPHYVANCLSFSNRVNGFDQNNNNAGHTMDNCTSAFNGGRNYDLDHGTNTTPHVVRNTVSLAGGAVDEFRSGSLLTNNSWQVIAPAVNVADFVSVMGSLATAPRQADGSLPVINFMRPVNGGRLVDQGVNVGRPFNGAAPDLGVFETGP